MVSLDLINTFINLINKKTDLHNEKIAFPMELRKDLPYVKIGLTLTQRQLLNTLKRLKSSTISEVARMSFLTHQYISKLSDKLLEIGLIEKTTSPKNKSAICLNLSEKGLSLLDETDTILFEYMKNRVKKLFQDDERINLLNNLRFTNALMAKTNGCVSYLHDHTKYIVNSDIYYEKLIMELRESTMIINKYNDEVQKSRDITVKKTKVNFTEINCVNTVYDYEILSISSLAKINIIPLDTTSKIVTKLVKNGTLERFQKPNDKRTYYVKMTKEGFARQAAIRSSFIMHLQKLFADVSSSDFQKLIDSFIYINEVLGKF